MNRTQQFSRVGLAGAAIGLLGVSATAQWTPREPVPNVDAQGQSGWGAGTIQLPTTSSMGLLTCALADGNGHERYTLDAKLTIFIPDHEFEGHGLRSGGLYGSMEEVPSGGMHKESDPPFQGYVEGVWRTLRDDSGTFLAFVYQRSEYGTSQLAGVITGKISPPEDGMPGPQTDGNDLIVLRSADEQQPRRQSALQDVAAKRGAMEVDNHKPGTLQDVASKRGEHGSKRSALQDVASREIVLQDRAGGKESKGKSIGKKPVVPNSANEAFRSASSAAFGTAGGRFLDDAYRVGFVTARFRLLN